MRSARLIGSIGRPAWLHERQALTSAARDLILPSAERHIDGDERLSSLFG
jgi:hypothetical protein